MVAAIEQKIEGKYLEESQRKAILENDKNVCVNAGAGSGKTLTIIGKIIHIFDKKLAEPENIVVVSYNTKVAEDLRNRLEDLSEKHPNLKDKLKRISISEDKGDPKKDDYVDRRIHTFHSYCYSHLRKIKNDTKLASYLNSKEEDIKKLKYEN